jgi:hypothetical protein
MIEEPAMRLPMQSQPVQRSIPSQPFGNLGTGVVADGERGVAPSGCGVQPSGWLDVIKGIGKVVQTVGPYIAPLL